MPTPSSQPTSVGHAAPTRQWWAGYMPQLVSVLQQGYSRQQLASDVGAGVVVGIVALPLALAFAIASGVPPARGMATAIVGGLIVSLLGGSRVQVAGPTGAFVVIVFGIVQQFGIDGLLVATMMAGVMMLALGLAQLGSTIKFVPQPVVTGFTSGIAVIIATSQVKDALGLQMGSVPVAFVAKWGAFAATLHSTSGWALGLTAVTILIVRWWPRVSTKVPSPFVALVVTTVLARGLALPVETIGSRFGVIDLRLPAPALPHTDLATMGLLVGPALTIALLGAIESLLSAVVADGMTGGRHRSNAELVAQGIANIVGPVFGGIPATGAIARTATNVRNGGRTPIAGIVHALTLIAIAYGIGAYAGMVPLATLAGILLVVAYGMSEWRTFRVGLRAPRSDVLVLLATFLLTVLVDLTVALEVGMVLSAFLFMKRMADVTQVQSVTAAMDDRESAADSARRAAHRRVPPGVLVFDIDGPLFFGAAEKFKEAMAQMGEQPRAMIFRLDGVPTIDATGIHLLRDLAARATREGSLLLLADVQRQPRAALRRAGLAREFPAIELDEPYDAALARATAYERLTPASAPHPTMGGH